MNQDLNDENLINGGSEKEGGVLKKKIKNNVRKAK